MWITKVLLFEDIEEGTEQQYPEGWEPIQVLIHGQSSVRKTTDVSKMWIKVLCRKQEPDVHLWSGNELQFKKYTKRELFPDASVRSKNPEDTTDYSIFGGMTQDQLNEHDAIVEADIAAGSSCASLGECHPDTAVNWLITPVFTQEVCAPSMPGEAQVVVDKKKRKSYDEGTNFFTNFFTNFWPWVS